VGQPTLCYLTSQEQTKPGEHSSIVDCYCDCPCLPTWPFPTSMFLVPHPLPTRREPRSQCKQLPLLASCALSDNISRTLFLCCAARNRPCCGRSCSRHYRAAGLRGWHQLMAAHTRGATCTPISLFPSTFGLGPVPALLRCTSPPKDVDRVQTSAPSSSRPTHTPHPRTRSCSCTPALPLQPQLILIVLLCSVALHASFLLARWSSCLYPCEGISLRRWSVVYCNMLAQFQLPRRR